MRIISPQEGRKGSDESPVRLNGSGIRSVQLCIPEASIETHVEPCGSDGWIGEISRVWERGPENTLELAKLLHRARRSMEHGAWAMEPSLAKPTASFLETQGGNARDYRARVGRNKCADISAFAFWLEHPVLHRPVRPEIGRTDDYRRPNSPASSTTPSTRIAGRIQTGIGQKNSATSQLERRLDRFSEFIRSHVANWTLPDRELFRAKLKRFLKIVPSKPNKLMNNPNSNEHIEFA